MKKRTHKQKVFELLSDHRWHGHMEGYLLGVMLHSRVADLRKDGHTIECKRGPEGYLYRLAGSLESPEAVTAHASLLLGAGTGTSGDSSELAASNPRLPSPADAADDDPATQTWDGTDQPAPIHPDQLTLAVA